MSRRRTTCPYCEGHGWTFVRWLRRRARTGPKIEQGCVLCSGTGNGQL